MDLIAVPPLNLKERGEQMKTDYSKWTFPNLAAECEKRGITQTDLAQAVKVKQETMGYWLRNGGKTKYFKPIAELLGTDNINYLFEMKPRDVLRTDAF